MTIKKVLKLNVSVSVHILNKLTAKVFAHTLRKFSAYKAAKFFLPRNILRAK